MRQYDRIAEGIESLGVFPNRNKLFASHPEHEMGLRQMTVDNFAVIYTVNDAEVIVIRVLYAKSDIPSRLMQE